MEKQQKRHEVAHLIVTGNPVYIRRQVCPVTHKSACSVSCKNALREDRDGDLKSSPLRFTVSKTA